MSKHVTRMTIYDAEHYTPEERAAIVASYPAHEREARSKGIPVLGSGRIFPVEESLITAAPEIRTEWYRIAGMDFGWTHPTAVAWLAEDRDTETVYLYDCYRRAETVVPIHASAIKSRGAWIPVAYPHDGENSTAAGAGTSLANQYRDEGVSMLADAASWTEGGKSVEAGLQLMLTMMEQGRFKVAPHLSDWWDEFRLYHRKDGKIVKEFDDLIDATRYGLMMLREAKQNDVPEFPKLDYPDLDVA